MKKIDLPIFESALLAEMEEKCYVKEVDTNDVLMDYGQSMKGVPILLSGALKVLRINPDGHELLLYYLQKGDGCAMSFTCCMQQKPSEIKVIAEEKSTLLFIPIELFDPWMSRYSSFKTFVMQTMQDRFDELIKSIDTIAFQKLDERLIHYLLEKKKITSSSVLHLSHENIARELATSRVVISRLLKKLELDKKVVLYRNEIKLLSGL